MKKLLFLFAIPVVLSVTSCKKAGCRDSEAVNYSSSAKKEDQSCTYKGEIVFWNDQTISQDMINFGITSLTYYVDGQVVGSSASSIYWTSSPSCGQNGSITITKDLGSAKNKSYNYSVVDQNDVELWAGVANFTANTCTKIQLN